VRNGRANGAAFWLQTRGVQSALEDGQVAPDFELGHLRLVLIPLELLVPDEVLEHLAAQGRAAGNRRTRPRRTALLLCCYGRTMMLCPADQSDIFIVSNV